jgi:hypothetical protein
MGFRAAGTPHGYEHIDQSLDPGDRFGQSPAPGENGRAARYGYAATMIYGPDASVLEALRATAKTFDGSCSSLVTKHKLRLT